MAYDLNGRRFSLTSATVELAGYVALGASELKLNEKLEPGEVEGTSPIPVGYTTGPWSGTGGLKLPLKEALDLKRSVGGAFGTAILTGVWTFMELDGDGVESITINGARITSTDFDGGDRSKASVIGFEFKLLQPCDWGGVKIVDTPDEFGLGGFSLSFGF